MFRVMTPQKKAQNHEYYYLHKSRFSPIHPPQPHPHNLYLHIGIRLAVIFYDATPNVTFSTQIQIILGTAMFLKKIRNSNGFFFFGCTLQNAQEITINYQHILQMLC